MLDDSLIALAFYEDDQESLQFQAILSCKFSSQSGFWSCIAFDDAQVVSMMFDF